MKRLITSIVLLVWAATSVLGQKFVHGEYFDFYFDNREFDVAGEKYMESETLFSALLAPEIGFKFTQDKKSGRSVEHQLMLGTDILRSMGSGEKPADSFKEVSIYYHVDYVGKRFWFEGAAGVFPRRFVQGGYTRAIWSDAQTFYDFNMEGMLLRFGTARFSTELGCDWMGRYGTATRERFQIFSSGCGIINNWLSAGWSGSFYHYATSAVAKNVIDNHLINPWLKADAARQTKALDELSIQAGILAGYQRSREIDPDPVLPVGAEFIFRARRKSLMLQNSVYTGNDLYHYYDYPAPEGGVYASDLYPGENTYRGFYDRAELIWAPRISKKTSLQITAAFHFDATGYQGCQQVVRLRTSF
jgi:hypothetical protein